MGWIPCGLHEAGRLARGPKGERDVDKGRTKMAQLPPAYPRGLRAPAWGLHVGPWSTATGHALFPTVTVACSLRDTNRTEIFARKPDARQRTCCFGHASRHPCLVSCHFFRISKHLVLIDMKASVPVINIRGKLAHPFLWRRPYTLCIC